MRIVFLGTPDLAVPVLEALLEAGHDIPCVVTQPDRPSGRRRRLAPPPVKVVAESRGLCVRQTRNVNQPAFLDALAELAPEALVVAAFGQKLGRRLLRLPPRGCINVHASLLPRHRGAAPVAHAILAGDHQTGATILYMGERMDAGDILAQEATPIGPRETAGELTERLARLGARLLVRTLDDLAAGRLNAMPQDEAKATLAPSLRKNDGLVDWTHPADYLARFVRAMTPWPGAFTFWTPLGKPPLRLVLLEADTAEGQATSPARVGSVADDRVTVETGGGLLHILRLQPAGKRPMTAAEFLRGHPIAAGDHFGWQEKVGG